MKQEKPSERIIEYISKHNVLIYGAGNVAGMLLDYLEQISLDKNIECLVQTTIPKNRTFKNYPLICLDEYKGTCKDIIIAVADDSDFIVIKEKLYEYKMDNIFDGRKLLFSSYNYDDEILQQRNNKKLKYLQQENKPKVWDTDIVATHITYPFSGNAGDTYLSYCVRHYLNFKEWNIISVSDMVTKEMINAINRTDVLIIGGGGLFLPDTNENNISGWEWAISEELLNKITVPIIVYSVGYNYFPGQTPSPLFVNSLNALIKKASFVGLRNMGSVQAIKKLIPDELTQKIQYQPCTTAFSSKYLDFKTDTESQTKMFALNMAFDRAERRYGDNNRIGIICGKIAKAMSTIVNNGYELVYVAHCEADLDFVMYLDAYKVPYHIKNLSHEFPKEIFDFYSKMNFVIGMRGHAQMIPFGVGTRIISLCSHEKLKWFLDDVSLTEMLIEIDDADIENKLIEKVNYMAEYSLEIDSLVKASMDSLYKISEKNKRYLLSLFEE